MKKWLATLLGVTVCGALAGHTPEAVAYVSLKCDGQRVKWASNPFIRASYISFPAGTVWAYAMQEAVDRWYQTPGNRWYTAAYGDTMVGLENGENEVWFTSDDDLLDGAPARNFREWSCGSHEIEETDSVFDSRKPFTTSHYKPDLSPYGGPFRPFQTVAIHELGHGLGLEHEADEYNVMGVDRKHIHANGATATAYVGEDAAYGVAAIYGLYPDPYEDLSVTHWKYAGYGNSGGYSVHARPRLFDGAGNLLASYTDNGEPRYVVQRGQQVQAEFTYENSGANSQNTIIDFHLSPDQYISGSDPWIGAYYLTLHRGNANTYTHALSIPAAIAPGKYALGVRVDRDFALSEMREDNNATHIDVEVQ